MLLPPRFIALGAFLALGIIGLGVLLNNRTNSVKGFQDISPKASIPEVINSTEVQNDSRDFDLNRARMLAEIGKYEEAEGLFESLLEKNPNDTEVLRDLVTFHHTQKVSLTDALRYEEQLLPLEKTRPHEFERYREIARAAKEEERALKFLDEMTVADESMAFAVPLTQAMLREDLKQYDKAVAKLREALEMKSDIKGPISEQLGTNLMRLREYKDAVSSLERGLEEFERHNEAFHDEPKRIMSTTSSEHKLIDAYLNTGHYQKALDRTEKLLVSDSQNPKLLAFKEMATMGLKGGK